MENKNANISQILITEEEITNRVKEIAAKITNDYKNALKPPCMIGLLKGSYVFMADLLRLIDLPVEVDFIVVSSYGNEMIGSEVRILKDAFLSLEGRDIIIIEDIIDTGCTLEKICDHLKTRSPSSLKICTLLNKPSRRKVDIKIDYNCFDIDDLFIVGYGIDYAQKYRNLPYIGVVEK